MDIFVDHSKSDNEVYICELQAEIKELRDVGSELLEAFEVLVNHFSSVGWDELIYKAQKLIREHHENT